jgi:hypothetical protein
MLTLVARLPKDDFGERLRPLNISSSLSLDSCPHSRHGLEAIAWKRACDELDGCRGRIFRPGRILTQFPELRLPMPLATGGCNRGGFHIPREDTQTSMTSHEVSR